MVCGLSTAWVLPCELSWVTLFILDLVQTAGRCDRAASSVWSPPHWDFGLLVVVVSLQSMSKELLEA